jgi:predicted TIM-barrel fold metal-dependent hydrolase
MRRDDLDPDGTRLPIKIDRTSNGEYVPPFLTPTQKLARRLAHEAASENARRLGLSRRAFLVSAAGAASTLAACNRANAGARGGSFAVDAEAALDQQRAEAAVGGGEFIFDVQTHCVEPSGRWAQGPDGQRWARTLRQVFGQSSKCANDSFDCYSAQTLAREVFLDSDTDAAVVSALWGQPNPTPVDYAAEARGIIEAIGGEGKRAMIHGGVFPQEPGSIEAMDEMARRHRVDAWKLYPQYGANGRGIFLDRSDDANRFFERARTLGVKTVAVHKGVPLPGLEYEYSSPRDMGPAAAANPDLTFLVYHGGFEGGKVEGPYNPENPQGVDRLIKSHQDAGLRRNQGNLYAEMGSLWRYFMSRPDEAAHVMGKLLRYFGEERIIWGTDSIWYGSPQDQIQAFRAFTISEEFQERHGYPALTAEAKRRIFGLNGARVYDIDIAALHDGGALAERRAAYRADPNPSFATYGPKTRREFLALWDARGGRPG